MHHSKTIALLVVCLLVAAIPVASVRAQSDSWPNETMHWSTSEMIAVDTPYGTRWLPDWSKYGILAVPDAAGRESAAVEAPVNQSWSYIASGTGLQFYQSGNPGVYDYVALDVPNGSFAALSTENLLIFWGVSGPFDLTLTPPVSPTSTPTNVPTNTPTQIPTDTPTPTATPTATPSSTSSPTTATPTATPTAIPAVELHLSGILTTTQELVDQQIGAWTPGSDTGPLFLGLAVLIFVFGLLMLVKGFLS